VAEKVTVGLARTGYASQTQWSMHLQAQRPRQGDEHPAYILYGTLFALPSLVLAAVK